MPQNPHSHSEERGINAQSPFEDGRENESSRSGERNAVENLLQNNA